MVTSTRKERERLEREAKILDLAQSMLRQVGYHGLSMDRIAAEMEYSKGTIYQHFPNKEEIILALANQALEQRIAMFQQAATCSPKSRERIAGIGAAAEEFVERYPQHFAVEQIIRSASMWEKTSEERRNFMRSCEQRCLQIVSGVVRDGVAQGDLGLPANTTPEELVFGLWSLNFGAYTVITSSDTLEENGIANPIATLRRSQNLLLDGYGWRPLSTEVDYDQVMDQVRAEVFGDEQPVNA